MENLRITRGLLACALYAVTSLGISACSGGGATIGSGGPSGVGSGGSGTGGSGTGGSGSATATPTAGAGSGSGSATATPSPVATTTPSGGGATSTPTTTPTSTPTGSASSTSTPSSLDTLNVLPAVVDGDLGGVAQIGILDPNYKGPYTVSVSGGGLLGNALNTLGNVVNGTLQGSAAGETTLTLNLANALQLGLLGPNGNAVTICEQQNPTTCKSVDIANNGVVPMVGSSVSSIVFGPSGVQTLNLIAPLLSLTNFAVTAEPQGITVTNLGNGMFVVDAAANIAVPLTGNITFSDGMGHTITIPIAVL